MLIVLSITLPIFLIVGLGYSTTKRGLFSASDMRIFGRFVITIALPALLFSAIAKRNLAEIFDPVFMGAYAAASLGMCALGVVWFHRIQGNDLARSAILTMGTACSNSGYMAFPIITLAFPDRAASVLAMCLLVENLVMIPTCLIIAAIGRGRVDGGVVRVAPMIAHILRDLLRRPLILALIAGLVWSQFALPLPEAFDRATTMIATSSIALALFVIGGSLAGVSFRGNLTLAGQISLAKLVVHPALAVFVLALIAATGGVLPNDLRACLILAAAVPMLGVYPIFAQEHGMENIAALAMLVTTVLSFFTLSLALTFLL